ncbi:hypothetical protein BT96DRAFT_988613 [Gymnopus androsaceus JB14]|uniref:Uncharacterized protein n=1 Tax=Gymnopus androsaceus JB14 TaxID=1447944 RepID=A0A6A4I9G5_9AGAR|nr:hypothetical protein BT96DRAFT_988613 [Gymnopus androsaceus JB14]
MVSIPISISAPPSNADFRYPNADGGIGDSSNGLRNDDIRGQMYTPTLADLLHVGMSMGVGRASLAISEAEACAMDIWSGQWDDLVLNIIAAEPESLGWWEGQSQQSIPVPILITHIAYALSSPSPKVRTLVSYILGFCLLSNPKDSMSSRMQAEEAKWRSRSRRPTLHTQTPLLLGAVLNQLHCLNPRSLMLFTACRHNFTPTMKGTSDFVVALSADGERHILVDPSPISAPHPVPFSASQKAPPHLYLKLELGLECSLARPRCCLVSYSTWVARSSARWKKTRGVPITCSTFSHMVLISTDHLITGLPDYASI